MEPGIYENVPFDEYLAIDAASNSRLNDMRRSASFCKWRMDHPSGESEWMKLGSAAHCALLEPEHFDDRYTHRPIVLKDDGTPWSVTAKAYKEEAARIEAMGLTILTDEQYEMARSVGHTVRSTEAGKRILDRLTHTELTAVAEVRDSTGTPQLAKVRPDLVCADAGLLIEFKTTRSADSQSFSRTIYNYGYHRAAALYRDVLEAAGMPIQAHAFIVMETEAPYLTRFYSLSESAVKMGREQYQMILARYAECKASGVWPGPPEFVVPIDLPIFAYNQHEQEMAQS